MVEAGHSFGFQLWDGAATMNANAGDVRRPGPRRAAVRARVNQRLPWTSWTRRRSSRVVFPSITVNRMSTGTARP